MRGNGDGGAPVVALLGDINIDLLLDIPVYPGPGGDAVASGQQMLLGGSVTNTAVVAARLGDSARLAGRVGQDSLGRLALDALTEERVDLSSVSVDPAEPTQLNIVVVTPDGERTMFAYRGANARLAPDQVSAGFLAGAAALHLSGYVLLASPQREAAWAAVERARAAGVPVTLDVPVAGAEGAREETRRLLPLLDLLVVGEAEASALTGLDDIHAATEALAGLGPGRVVVKRGALGSRMRHGDSYTEMAALPVKPVDTTGAGDAFAAGVVHALVHGLDDQAALVLANTLGGLATTCRGAGTALPRRAQVAGALESGWSADRDLAAAAARALATLMGDPAAA
ncbi:carbohydrate kinase family protein [Planotetraspora sp. A-T 1434]|uniref:carbohydrate kinase family protein n=1 Tax=Planotetraspora sp. A-T 1434 TaxID=2979219 RepID=UPI0021BE9A45|nr:carbohydrate kinase family protein [Planotetraspora sp. A-T 1434]MCT9929874.1 carbohydrate kinase family protein [Planotetraspora sp. A-T 1434]